MITVISGTNRPDSRTLVFARHYVRQLELLGEEVELLDMADLHHGYFAGKMYDPLGSDGQLLKWQQQYISAADKLAVFVPEYNGSYPGVLKLFIDGISVIDYTGNFAGKHVALVGVSSGRAGNLRGIDHLADVFAHMGAWVLPNRLPLSSVEGLLTDDEISDAETKKSLKQQAEQLIAA
ncbi:FMN-dependent NADPH-azoreductase [Neolewinella maritima]|uniref:FMN-dependent NADPH-azoreductase n=1 Tax=Neolewinella maritima TaxID=1383882 RepID=A0ABM9AYN9_9BACT|nr:NAD(P)H-dependent oxidoreductase [Neolewinella maritima]CAH0999871.1 FMN-dependent NADPH-azoreductase [Neolewinella maritima]